MNKDKCPCCELFGTAGIVKSMIEEDIKLDKEIKKESSKKRSLTALQITTDDIKFDRDEANER